MSKVKTAFFCSNCGYESAKWLGKCPSCEQWNTFVEEIVQKDDAGKKNDNYSTELLQTEHTIDPGNEHHHHGTTEPQDPEPGEGRNDEPDTSGEDG